MKTVRKQALLCILVLSWTASLDAEPLTENSAVSLSGILETRFVAPKNPEDPRQEGLSGLVFGVDGHTVITGSSKYGGKVALRIWDLRQPQGKPIELDEHMGPFDAIDLSGDGKLLATGDYEGAIRLWDLTPIPKKKAGFQWFKYAVTALALSPDGKLLAASGDDGLIGLLDLSHASQSPMVLDGHSNRVGVTCLAFSADGQMLASSMVDGTIRVWKTARPKSPPVVLCGHKRSFHPLNKNYDQNYVRQLEFSRNGQFLVAGAGDGSVQIWEASQLAKPPRVFPAHDGSVISISLNQDSTLLATSGTDHKILIWNLSNPDAPPHVAAYDKSGEVVFDPTGEFLGAVIDGAIEFLSVRPVTVTPTTITL